MSDSDPIQRLIHAFSRLPGIGVKTAARLTFFVLDAPDEIASELAAALVEVKERVRLCSTCCNLTETDPCRVCADNRRDDSMICVVESVQAMLAIERTGEYRGRYHILHGVLAPLDGVGPDQIRLKELLGRLGKRGSVSEIIVATNPSVEGEATGLYLQRLLAPLGLRLTRLCSGVPIGADLEYADAVTLGRAISGRLPL